MPETTSKRDPGAMKIPRSLAATPSPNAIACDKDTAASFENRATPSITKVPLVKRKPVVDETSDVLLNERYELELSNEIACRLLVLGL